MFKNIHTYTHIPDRYGNALQERFESAEQWREADSADDKANASSSRTSGKARAPLYEEEELDFNTFEDQDAPYMPVPAASEQASAHASTSKQSSRADVHANIDEYLDETNKAVSGGGSIRTPTSVVNGTPLTSVHVSASDLLLAKSDEALSRSGLNMDGGKPKRVLEDTTGDDSEVGTGDVVKEQADAERRESDGDEDEEESDEEDEDAISMKRKKALQDRPVDQMTAASEHIFVCVCACA
jgi:hypothetical protein